jgi:uncharacterized protein involved in tolerance to divalent cations
MSNYLLVQISAETKEQAYAILDALLAKKLVTGGQIIVAPARFLWKEKLWTWTITRSLHTQSHNIKAT